MKILKIYSPLDHPRGERQGRNWNLIVSNFYLMFLGYIVASSLMNLERLSVLAFVTTHLMNKMRPHDDMIESSVLAGSYDRGVPLRTVGLASIEEGNRDRSLTRPTQRKRNASSREPSANRRASEESRTRSGNARKKLKHMLAPDRSLRGNRACKEKKFAN
ncbi:unnamed protein product [Trichogramma brassicae]|uniref:Uncharacterized protein n=1 Tax=Trichogramma brassicae TaxID=86971 RepID=A0A6H5HXY5_9HYME|nr:unnamed protein product [Trichogramma brassicae]